MKFDYCRDCTFQECNSIGIFLEMYNKKFNSNYRMVECPDKKEPGKKGKKPDAILQDENNSQKIALEMKEIYHSEGKM